MKTEEDEAFDELAKRQGAWGGGFPAKRQMAMDKLQEPAQECPNLKNCEGACFQCEYFNAETGKTEYPAPQPAQEPRNVRERWNIELDGDDLLVCFNDHEKGDKCQYERYSPLPVQERNFCPRCGKRTNDIHTCTPPQGAA